MRETFGIGDMIAVGLHDSSDATLVTEERLDAAVELIRAAVTGPPESVDLLASFARRP